MGDTILRLDANEGRPVIPAAALARRIDADCLRRYPDARPLERAIAARLGVAPARVIATAGADDAIDRAVRCLAGPGGAVVSSDPSFVEYAAAAARSGARYVALPRMPGEPFPMAGALAALAAERSGGRRAVAIAASPDNPGGTVLGQSEVEDLAGPGFPVILDLTYAAFACEGVGAGLVAARPPAEGVVVTGSLSKAFGMAGLRIGWACGPEALVAALRQAGPPYSLSTVAIEAGLAALESGEAGATRFVAEVRRERELLAAELSALGARCWPGQANFATAYVRDAPELSAALAAAGILVRTWTGGGPKRNLVRITCPGDEGEFERLAGALRAVAGLVGPAEAGRSGS